MPQKDENDGDGYAQVEFFKMEMTKKSIIYWLDKEHDSLLEVKVSV